MRNVFIAAGSLSAEQRVLEAVRRWFVMMGGAPSHVEIAVQAHVAEKAVGRLLRRLAADGHIRLAPGVRRGISLPDPSHMLSTSQLILLARSRGLIVTEPPAAAAPIAEAYRVEGVTDLGGDFSGLLSQVDDAEQEWADGGGGDGSNGTALDGAGPSGASDPLDEREG